ncbi:MAG: glycosyltransferase family 39 protein [Xanthobacteraceae bacterium]
MTTALSFQPSASMLYVSPIVEALRGRPRLVFWTATLTQALLWVLVPSLFYASPPGEVPLVLAVGHEWQLGSAYGPPLAYWLAELAFRLAGGSVVGVYLLSQACVVTTFWAVFALGRAIVGLTHAALAVLLMVGISAFAVPSPDFGPAVLAMPLTALALLSYWRAVGEGHRGSWIALGIVLGLLMLTTYFGAILLALIVVFTLATERGRATLRDFYPYVAMLIACVVALPHLVWLLDRRFAVLAAAADATIAASVIEWLKLLAALIAAHAGLAVLVIVAGILVADRKAAVPEFVRQPVDPFPKLFVYTFALAPAVVAALIAAIGGQADLPGGMGALVVLSGLAVIVLTGDVIRLYHQNIAGWTWAALLVGPPALAVVSIIVLPWTLAMELKVNEPAADMGRFFTESFNRRTGKPLAIVVGDGRLASLVALASPQRPSVLIDAAYERAPWVSEAHVRAKGAIVVWPIADAAGAPPAHIRARFPDLVPEVPHAFERAFQGRLPLMRVGWAMIRPQTGE